MAPSNPNIVWAGTGEAWAIRDIDVMGNGIYKSTDAGKTWTHMGLDETGRIGRIIVHPTNPDIVFACALGRMTGPQQERGVYRTTDGGKTLGSRAVRRRKHRLLRPLDGRAESATCSSPACGRSRCTPTAMFSGGPGSGVYVSHDGGTTWKRH